MPSNDKNYQREYIKKHYQENKQYYKDKAKSRREAFKKYWQEVCNRYKLKKGCIDCGYNQHSVALDFDHVKSDKVSEIARMIATQRPSHLIRDEIRKCDVRCANCHRIITEERRKSVALSS